LIRRIHILLVLIALALLNACSSAGGELAVRSQSDPQAVLKSGFETAIYGYNDGQHVTIVLYDGPIENPTQAVTIRMMWLPRAGGTPIDATATNATIHYMIFTGSGNDLLGVYSGAGYMYPSSTPGKDSLTAAVWEANLRLSDRSEQFTDLLGQAILKGKFVARRDDAGTIEAVRMLNSRVSACLGYPRVVKSATQSNGPG
jgi:hypothetical protein